MSFRGSAVETLRDFVEARDVDGDDLLVEHLDVARDFVGAAAVGVAGEIRNGNEPDPEHLANADDRVEVPGRIGSGSEDRHADFALPHARHVDADAAAGDLHPLHDAAVLFAAHQLLRQRRVEIRIVAEQDVLVRERALRVDRELHGTSVGRDAMHLLGARTIAVDLAGHHVADERGNDVRVLDERDHRTHTVRLAADVRLGSVERVDGEPQVRVRHAAVDGQMVLLGDDAVVREGLPKELFVDPLCRDIGVGHEVFLRRVVVRGLCLGLEEKALRLDHVDRTAHSLLHRETDEMPIHTTKHLVHSTCSFHKKSCVEPTQDFPFCQWFYRPITIFRSLTSSWKTSIRSPGMMRVLPLNEMPHS